MKWFGNDLDIQCRLFQVALQYLAQQIKKLCFFLVLTQCSTPHCYMRHTLAMWCRNAVTKTKGKWSNMSLAISMILTSFKINDSYMVFLCQSIWIRPICQNLRNFFNCLSVSVSTSIQAEALTVWWSEAFRGVNNMPQSSNKWTSQQINAKVRLCNAPRKADTKGLC